MLRANLILRFVIFSLMCSYLPSYAQDAKASQLISENLKALGGKKAYDKTRHITWNFFGVRTIYWDKYTGDVRIEIPRDKAIILWNSNTGDTQVKMNNRVIDDESKIKDWANKAQNIWINDSYWLVMPYKLQDPGVQTKYLGKLTTLDSLEADAVELTFEEVGVTPNNKYIIYFHPTKKWVCQWDFFREASNDEPNFSMPWQNYEQFDKIWLSGDRGERKLSNIKTFKKLPESVYSSFDKVEI